MLTVPTKVQTKVVGTSGQISLGKQYAGQQVIIEEIEPGEWRIQTAITIPRSQAWVHSKTTQTQLVESLKWANTTPAKATELGKLAKKLGVGNAIK
jgi:hypothetical protein